MSQLYSQKKESFEENSDFSLEEKLTLNFSLSQCQKDIFYKIEIVNPNSSLGEFPLFETEKVKCENENSEILFSKTLKCNFIFNKRQPFLIRIKKGYLIDSTILYQNYERVTILSSLITSPNSIYERNIEENNGISEKIIIKLNKDIKNNDNNLSIFNLLKTGKKLSCYISLDFSNCDQKYYSDSKDNFIEIMEKISNIIFNYTENHTFYVYGIGGRFDKGDLYQSPFNINMNEDDSSINSYKEIIENYKNCLDKIQPYDNIFLSPLIKNVKEQVDKLYDGRLYSILFILLKEKINKLDINMSRDAIIESSSLPLTIAIIDIGTDNFEYMNDIFNCIPNYSNKGIKKYRNNLLYYSLYHNFEDNIEKMFYTYLKEISKQMIEFFNLEKEGLKSNISSNIFDSIKGSVIPFDNDIYKSNNSNLKDLNTENVEKNIIVSGNYNDYLDENIENKKIENDALKILNSDVNNNISSFSNRDSENIIEPIRTYNKKYTFQMPKLYDLDDSDNTKTDGKEIKNNIKKIPKNSIFENNNIEIKKINMKNRTSEYASTTYSEINKESNILSINNFPK